MLWCQTPHEKTLSCYMIISGRVWPAADFRGDRSKYESIPLETNNLVRKQLDVKQVTIMMWSNDHCSKILRESVNLSFVKQQNGWTIEQSTCKMMMKETMMMMMMLNIITIIKRRRRRMRGDSQQCPRLGSRSTTATTPSLTSSGWISTWWPWRQRWSWSWL